MKRAMSLSKWIDRMAQLVIITLICSDIHPLVAEEAESIVNNRSIEVSQDRAIAGQALTTANVSITKDRSQATNESGNPLRLIPLTSLSATRERPIFSPTRRPPAVPLPVRVTIAPPSDLGRPNLSLVGTISGDHENFAILLDETTKVMIRLRTGESHLGWTLQIANGREVTLQKDHETATLTLSHPHIK